jgi:bacillithiol biosynthesis cysteine-adding enzyme BshC
MPNQADPPDHLTPIGVDVRRLPWIRRLAADYAFDFRALAPFFSGDPADQRSWSEAIGRTVAHPRNRQQIAAVIGAQQKRRGAPPRAVEAAQKLGDSRAVAVLTGQQAGLFGGPLYTLLKAITAIKLADRVSREHNVPAVPVFWIDAEDHDWNEVRSCTVFDETLSPSAVSLPPQQTGHESAPIATIRLDDSIGAAIDALERILPATEFRAELMAGLREAYQPGIGVADAFGRWMERVLGHLGLVVYDSSDAASKPLAAGVFARELSTPGHTVTLAGQAGSRLESCGYHAQVQAASDSVALFRLDGGRRSIKQQAGTIVVGEDRYPAAVLVKEATEHPTSFSPNVLLRPIVQDTIFPTICYVAGPSELAYLGQLGGVYDHFGVPMPLMFPRASATLIDAPALRFFQKYNVPLEALQPQDESGLNELLKSQIPASVEHSLAEAGDAIADSMARLIQAVPAIDPTLEGTAKSTLGRMQHDLETLNGKIIQAAKRRDETLRRQYARTRALAFPNGHPQEREIGFVSFLNQYGPALVECLLDKLPLDLGRHWVVSI